MKQRLLELAAKLRHAVGTDMPRGAMQDVARELEALAEPLPEDEPGRAMAFDLAHSIDNHQYGLRGFGDGSLTRGRDFSREERATIIAALLEYARS